MILHLFNWDKKFAPSFINFISERFDSKEHFFILYGVASSDVIKQTQNVIFFETIHNNLFKLSVKLRRSSKVIIHGLFNTHLIYTLALQPWILKKCYWVIWGDDLYIHEKQQKDWRWAKNEFIRCFIIRRFGNLVTHIRGDFELAQKWYAARGRHHDCFMYPSNIYIDPPYSAKKKESICILLGNSATETNNHLDAFERLRPYASDNILIYCPLSYGIVNYGNYIEKIGREIFGDKFIPLRTFIKIHEYHQLLNEVDIGIFNHSRQQGMGNIIPLLGLGKMVYMRKGVSTSQTLKALGFRVFDIESFSLAPACSTELCKNTSLAKLHFSASRLQADLSQIFSD